MAGGSASAKSRLGRSRGDPWFYELARVLCAAVLALAAGAAARAALAFAVAFAAGAMEADPAATAAWVAHVANAGRPRPPQIPSAMYKSGWREQTSNVEQVMNDLREKQFTIVEVKLDVVPEWNNPDVLMLRLLVVLVETSGCQGYLGHVTLFYGKLDASLAINWVQVMQRGMQSRVSFRECGHHVSKRLQNKSFTDLRWRPQVDNTGQKVVCTIPRSNTHHSDHKFFEFVVSELMGDLRLEFCEGQRAGRIYTTTGPAGVRPGSGRVPVVDFYVVFLS